MDGIHDLGGLSGLGPVNRTPNEHVVTADWERRILRLIFATVAASNPSPPPGRIRHAIERIDPAYYLASSYYEHWLTGVTTLAVESGLTSREELERSAGVQFRLSRPDPIRLAPASEPDRTEPRFAVGARVRVREWHPAGHTRAPRYVQGRRGTIVRTNPAAHYPDLQAHGGGDVLDPIYCVRFDAAELWGDGGGAAETIHVDLWERYLEEESDERR